MHANLENGKQYYPTDTAGVIDEWAALAMQQDNYWNRKAEQEKAEKKLRQQQYLQDLDRQRKFKGILFSNLFFLFYVVSKKSKFY